ncbi:hypothetical protein B0H13DRAFT_2262518 [Mycena leptocephala]|nr:hypothetical protein B0H13DRAFT_2262518 [Mycena leptocephala]
MMIKATGTFILLQKVGYNQAIASGCMQKKRGSCNLLPTTFLATTVISHETKYENAREVGIGHVGRDLGATWTRKVTVKSQCHDDYPSVIRHSTNLPMFASGEELFQASNQAYISLMMERNMLEARLQESRRHTAGIFRCDANVLKLRSQDKYPDVKYWTLKDYNAKGSDLSTIIIDDDDEGNRYKGYPWVEGKEGNSLDKSASKALSSHLRTALNFVGSKKRAPNHWSHADLEVINYVRSEMYTVFPDLRLCAHHWKLLVADISDGRWWFGLISQPNPFK